MAMLATICLALWLLLMGIDQAFGLKIPNKNMVLGMLAIITGVISLLMLLF